jgi:hypothetical protein
MNSFGQTKVILRACSSGREFFSSELPSSNDVSVPSRWPQYCDEILEDMKLPSWRSGGNGLTWPFKVVNVKEIETLTEERIVRREQSRTVY